QRSTSPNATFSRLANPPGRPRWQTGLWLSIGVTHPAAQLGIGLKSYESAPLSTGSGQNRTVVYRNSNRRPAYNLAGGLAVQKQLGKNFMLLAGTGIGISRWHDEGRAIQDSFTASGMLVSSIVLQTYNQQYARLSLQMPVQIAGKIGQKRHHSFWWTAGTTQHITLQVSAKQKAALPPGGGPLNFASSSQHTALAYTWQPTFTLGALYQHKGRHTWQLAPQLSLPVRSVFNASTMPTVYPVEAQLQWRWMLK
ncbi:MAG TPA: hypothetical protein PKD90_07695, partial [Phnomibacter sp.]|nr:hypothetical protein [Phnomibacter sp.]